MISGPDVYICDECLALCNDIVNDEKQAEAKEYVPKSAALKPIQINDHLNEYVIGQDFAKKSSRWRFIIIINESMLRLMMVR